MPQKRTIAKARKDRRAGKAPSTQAGEFVQEEIHKIHRGAHGARSPEQAIAIGLSMARRAGVKLRPPAKGKAKSSTRKSAKYAYAAAQHKRKTHRRPRVSRAVTEVLKREPRSTVSRAALSRQPCTPCGNHPCPRERPFAAFMRPCCDLLFLAGAFFCGDHVQLAVPIGARRNYESVSPGRSALRPGGAPA